MKSNELLPTYENLLFAFQEDVFKRNADVVAFVSLLNDIDGPYSIAIDGKWGSGKTFFVKQAKMMIEAYNEFCNPHNEDSLSVIKGVVNGDTIFETKITEHPQVPVYYDAWLYDNDCDPLLSLVYEIIRTTDSDYKFKLNEDFIGALTGVIDAVKGISLSSTLSAFSGKDVMEHIRASRVVDGQIEDFLESLIVEKGNRLVIFIDELDRCRPSFAIQLLERIKHYFSHDFITFVFSVNLEELQHTVKAYYGTGMNANRYLDRFFNMRTSLTIPTMANFYNKIGFKNGSSYVEKMTELVINELGMTPREIIRFTESMVLLSKMRTPSFGMSYAVRFCRTFVAPILIGLKMVGDGTYNRLINGEERGEFVRLLTHERIARAVYETITGSWANVDYCELESLINQIYDLLYGNKKISPNEEKKVGNLYFEQYVINDLEKTIGLI